MEWDNALVLLSQAHNNEVQRWRKMVADLESALGNKCGSEGGDLITSRRRGEHISIDKEISAIENWGKLGDHVLSSYDPKGLGCVQGHGTWKRWMLLSHRLIEVAEAIRSSAEYKQVKIVKFQLIPVWVKRTNLAKFTADEHFRVTHVDSRGGDLMIERMWLRRYIFHPHSMRVFVWGFLSGLIVLYDIFMIPMDLCGLLTNPTVLAWAFLFFWIADMGVSCFTGVERSDCVVDMRIKTIWRTYAKTWLVPDLLVIFADFILLGVDVLVYLDDSASDFSSALRANRVFRLIRLIRLCRVRKIIKSWYALTTPVHAAFLILIGKLVQQIMVIITVNHYIACLWYGLAVWLQNDKPTWLEAVDHREESMFASYVYSLHWALTQVSPSTQNISAQNPYERLFALCVALFALVMFSWFIGQLNNSLNQLFKATGDRQRQEQLMRDFFRVREISTELGSVIMKFFYCNFEALKVRTAEEDIQFFTEVPESMRLRLHEEMYMHVLMSHMFFAENYNPTTRGTLLKICHTAMREITASPTQDIFILGADAKFIHVVTQGKVLYKQRKKVQEAVQNEWISEMGLWVKWEHVGTLSSPGDAKCELSAINLNTCHGIFTLQDTALLETFRLLAIFAVEQVELAASHGIPPSDMPLHEMIREEISRRANLFEGIKRRFHFSASRGACDSHDDFNSRFRFSLSPSLVRGLDRKNGRSSINDDPNYRISARNSAMTLRT